MKIAPRNCLNRYIYDGNISSMKRFIIYSISLK